MSTTVPETPAPAASEPPVRHAWRRRALLLVGTPVLVVSLLIGAVGSISWHFSSVALRVDQSIDFPLTIENVAGPGQSPGTVTLPRDAATARPGTWALIWKNGRALLGPVVGGNDEHVERKVTSVVEGTLVKGAHAAIDHWVYDGDPKKALGLDFQNVTYMTQVGPMPAWLLPGASPKRTWVIAIHGRNADKAETFRAMKAVHAQGLPMLSIAYRNDVGAPPSDDGKNHLGDTEWHDVNSAVGYARAHGATGVVLYGWSMGGAMTMRVLPGLTSFVRGVVLDSPVMDWNATLNKQGDERHLPRFLTGTAKTVLEQRIGIDLSDYDQRRYAPELSTPVLLFTTNDDETVANGPSYTFARTAPPGMVTHVRTAGGHTEAWNVNPPAYENNLGTFLKKVA
ncbi:alpha/beta fold hydrolase [Actinomadura meridiana]|uniref:Alpha/beta fold hydrolase n=1 Tax=Actinomadura meridiana TaxID=559626 RepID=A0ABP8BSF5_9ACTN